MSCIEIVKKSVIVEGEGFFCPSIKTETIICAKRDSREKTYLVQESHIGSQYKEKGRHKTGEIREVSKS